MHTVRLLAALVFFQILAPHAWADAVERMAMEKLRATHAKVESFQKELRKVSLESGYDDVRALLHVHSAFSHDSRGTIDEIVAAAKKVGVRAILFTEHPANHYDYVVDGHQGMKDGVLLIPGAETEGFLAYPKTSIQGEKGARKQQFSDLVKGTGGMIFLCHLEERMDWEIGGLTGSEIYNTHADLKDEPKLLAAMRSPLFLFTLVPAVKEYPQEVFAALQDYPADYLKRWDQLCQKARHTGVSANDAHHNQGFHARLTEEGKVQLEDGLGKKLAQLDPEKLPPLKALVAGKKPGESVLDLEMDPYERSFHHVSTHLLMHELTTANVCEALNAGRAYVAFDWMADPSGFVFRADRDGDTWPMGSEVPGPAGVRLRAEAPLNGTLKLIRNGEVVSEQAGNALDTTIDRPGNYRVEVWLTLAGEARPWILSNPIYVRPAG
jgi:PHP domain